MKTYRDEGLVLGTVKLGEADRVITLLTRQHGKIRAVAKGVRRTSSKFGARLEPFMYVDLQCFIGKNLDTIVQVETIGAYGQPISQDYDLYLAASAIIETANRLVQSEREPQLQQFLLATGAIRTLATAGYQAQNVLDSYLLRALAIGGWALSLTVCAKCARPGDYRSFSISQGGAVCSVCVRPGATLLHPETTTHLSALLVGQWEQIETVSAEVRAESSRLIRAYAQYYLERNLKSLRMMNSRPQDSYRNE